MKYILVNGVIIVMIFSLVNSSLYKKTIMKRAASGEKSKKMCEQYAESVFTYQSPPILPGPTKVKLDNCRINETPLIPEGINPGEFPHMVLIGLSTSDGNSSTADWACAGSLISDRWVLSAAHCTSPARGSPRWARLGDLKGLSNDDEAEVKPVVLKIIEIVTHPDYNRYKVYNDIALYKLEKPVDFNEFIRPICLNTVDGPYTGKTISTGWETIYWNSQGTLMFRKELFNEAPCNETIIKVPLPQLPKGITAESMICAFSSYRGKDTCQSYSGGPLQIKLDKPYCMYTIVGIKVFDKACDKDFPGIFTKVSKYVPWIESIVWP